MGVVVSLIISILKSWFKLKGKVINLINVILGIIAVAIYAIVEGSMTLPTGIIFALGVAFSSTPFHENLWSCCGGYLRILGEKPQKEEESRSQSNPPYLIGSGSMTRSWVGFYTNSRLWNEFRRLRLRDSNIRN